MDNLKPTLEAWRILRTGSREVVDAIVAPEHRGPSAALRAALRQWPGAYYWPDADRAHLVLIRPIGPPRRERWLLHLALLLLTVICSLGAGAILEHRFQPPQGPGLFGALLAGFPFFINFLQGTWQAILSGWSFAFPLLGILLIHELGHYFAARRYGIDASPPYFLPIPPSVSPIGSLGAFIRLRSPVVDRQQLMDVGAAGPMAGFIAALAVMAWGYATSQGIPQGHGFDSSVIFLGDQPVQLGESLLSRGFREYFLPGAPAVHLSLPGFAGWVGAFVTGLNLLPLSQLDGGHVLYGLLGRRQATVGLVALAGLVYLAQSTWTWYVWVALVLLIGRGRVSHPSVISPERRVPPSRRIIGLLCILIFVLTFVPVPFKP